jgi:hypothetical protein
MAPLPSSEAATPPHRSASFQNDAIATGFALSIVTQVISIPRALPAGTPAAMRPEDGIDGPAVVSAARRGDRDGAGCGSKTRSQQPGSPDGRNAVGQPDERSGVRTVIGGRHGSPSLTIALPFARITRTDSELRDDVAALAALVAQLATSVSSGDAAGIGLSRTAAEELADRISSRD